MFERTTLFYQQVTILDYAYLDKQLGPMGNSLFVDAFIEGPLDFQGMIMDFGKVKPTIKRIIDEYFDHRLILTNEQSQNFNGTEVFFEWKNDQGINKFLKYKAPEECFYSSGVDELDCAGLEKSLSLLVNTFLERPTLTVTIKVRSEFTEVSNVPFFYYTHGLKHHEGNCQRLLHGHGNTIKVKINNILRNDIAFKLVSKLTNSLGSTHFIYEKNIKQYSSDSITVQYQSTQGMFQLEMSPDYVLIIPCETTIEQLSQYFCQVVVKEFAEVGDIVEVAAFEGIAKGAITVQKNSPLS